MSFLILLVTLVIISLEMLPLFYNTDFSVDKSCVHVSERLDLQNNSGLPISPQQPQEENS